VSRRKCLPESDDHDMVRAEIKMILHSRRDWEICGEASDGGEAVEKAESLGADVVVLDASMPSLNGLQAAEQITHLPGTNRVLIFTMHDSDSIGGERSRRQRSCGQGVCRP